MEMGDAEVAEKDLKQ